MDIVRTIITTITIIRVAMARVTTIAACREITIEATVGAVDMSIILLLLFCSTCAMLDSIDIVSQIYKPVLSSWAVGRSFAISLKT